MYHARSASAPEALIQGLSERSMKVQTSPSVHEVLALACRSTRVREPSVVVLDDPSSLSDLDRLLDVMDRFCPGTLVWAHESGANPPLRAFVEAKKQVSKPADPPAPVPQVRRREQATTPVEPELRLTGQGPIPTTRDILDQDELDALLGNSD